MLRGLFRSKPPSRARGARANKCILDKFLAVSVRFHSLHAHGPQTGSQRTPAMLTGPLRTAEATSLLHVPCSCMPFTETR